MATGPPAASGGNDAESLEQLGADRLHRFLRFSHIFSSAVREVLEAKFLKEVSPDSISLPQFHLLKLITLNGSHQVGEVAEFLGVSSPAVSKNIDKLERQGLVNRIPSQGDRRATLLNASPRGHDLIRRYDRLKAARLAPVLRRFTLEEIDELSRLLERFAVLLFGAEKSEHTFCLRCAAYCEENCPIGNILDSCPYEKIRSRNRLT